MHYQEFLQKPTFHSLDLKSRNILRLYRQTKRNTVIHYPCRIVVNILAHYISRASWEGAHILASTMSMESPLLYKLFVQLFTVPATFGTKSPKMIDLEALKIASQVDDETWSYFLEYVVQVCE